MAEGWLTIEEMALLYDESREKAPPSERQSTLNRRLAEQVLFACNNAPAVRSKFDAAGVAPSEIKTVQDLERLPVTTKDELVRLQQANPPFGGVLAVPLASLKRVYVSPGPIYDAVGPERIRSAVRGFLRAGYPRPGDVALVSMAYHMVPGGLFMTDALDAMGCTVIPAGTGQTDLQVKVLHDLQATAVFGFPSFVMGLLKKAEEMGYDVRRDLNLKYVQGIGERHIELLRQTFREDYGLKLIDGYGTADLGEVAYACGIGQGYHFADEDCVVEIVDPDTGKQVGPMEEGEVVVTLFSEVYPLVRFGTGDLAFYTDEPCACGRTSPRIPRITGMVGDHVRVKGMFVHGRELDEALSKFPQILDYQMVLTLEGQRDRISLNLEVEPGVEEEGLADAIVRSCQDVFKLKVDRLEFRPRGTLAPGHARFWDRRWEPERPGT